MRRVPFPCKLQLGPPTPLACVSVQFYESEEQSTGLHDKALQPHIENTITVSVFVYTDSHHSSTVHSVQLTDKSLHYWQRRLQENRHKTGPLLLKYLQNTLNVYPTAS